MKNNYWSVEVTRNTKGSIEEEDLGLHIIESVEKPEVDMLFRVYNRNGGYEVNTRALGPIQSAKWAFLDEEPLVSGEGCKVWVVPKGGEPD